MAELNNMLDTLKERTEEAFKCYANKENWEPQDLKCAKEAAELYDKLQTIQMNTGIWEGIKEDGYSGAHYPRISYDESMRSMRGMSRGTGYSDTGRSMHSVKDQAIQRLEALMDTAESDYERQEIMKMIETIEKQKR